MHPSGTAEFGFPAEHVRDLATRWSNARVAALKKVLAEAHPESEPQWALRALSLDSKQTLKNVFDNSLALGRSFCRHHGLVLERADLVAVLPHLEVECTDRHAGHEEAFAALARTPCPNVSVCDYFREAIDGLVLGLSDGEVFHRRHRSAGHADETCMDVLFEPAAGTDALRFGAIPQALSTELDALARRLRLMPGINVRFAGVSEGVLSYEILTAGTDIAADAVVKTQISRRFPQLTPRSVAPLAVISEEANT